MTYTSRHGWHWHSVLLDKYANTEKSLQTTKKEPTRPTLRLWERGAAGQRNPPKANRQTINSRKPSAKKEEKTLATSTASNHNCFWKATKPERTNSATFIDKKTTENLKIPILIRKNLSLSGFDSLNLAHQPRRLTPPDLSRTARCWSA